MTRATITFVAEVIESKFKPSQPLGDIASVAFGEALSIGNRGLVRQSILAIGIQDIDFYGLQVYGGIEVLGGSSDYHNIELAENELFVIEEVLFQLNYSALARAKTSSFVSKVYTSQREKPHASAPNKNGLRP